jgi:hypothetical protein
VYVTGTFDNWSKSEKLEKVGDIFVKDVTLSSAAEKIYYKVRDGNNCSTRILLSKMIEVTTEIWSCVGAKWLLTCKNCFGKTCVTLEYSTTLCLVPPKNVRYITPGLKYPGMTRFG